MKTLGRIAAVALVLMNAVPARASSSAGTAGVGFLKFPVGARAIAMGEAASSTAQGAEALFWNPANMGAGRSVDLILNHQPMLEFMNYDVGAAAWSNGFFSTGLGFARLTHKDLDVLDLTGTKVRSAQAFDQQFAIGAAIAKNRWGIGASVKSIQSKLDDASATAVAGDVGLRFPGFLPNLNHALTVQNIGSTISYDRDSYPVPLVFRAGSNLKVRNAIFSVDAMKARDAALAWGAGAELPVYSTRAFRFKLRGGYRTGEADLGKLASLSLGSGLEMGAFRLDYAWRPNGDFGDSHNVSLGYQFNLRSPDAPTKKPAYKRSNESGRYRLPPVKGK